MSWEVVQADCLEHLRSLPDGSIDAVVTDPPYGLEFMGKEWDRLAGVVDADGWAQGESSPYSRARVRHNAAESYGNVAGRARAMQSWHEAWASEALRVLKPGGHMLVFGGTRTYHRLAAGVEDAGFEVRDCLAWMFGSGFPKSLNLTGEHEGRGTALKPAFEPIVMARKPLVGTVGRNVAEQGTGALNIDGCRVGFRGEADERESKEKNRHGDFGTESGGNEVYGDFSMVERRNYDASGRWPANVVLDEEAAAQLDEQTGELAAGNHPARRQGIGFTAAGGGVNSGTEGERRPTETGGASRFFYVAKASSAERNAGLDGFEEARPDRDDGRTDGRQWDIPGSHSKPRRNVHPTVKPIALMRWLVRLVTPPGGRVLDPFTGSGTTGCAATLEGFDFLGVEREADYAEIARARIGWWAEHPEGVELVRRLELEAERKRTAERGQLDLLGEAA